MKEKLNYRFAKPQLKLDGTPDYSPAILNVVTHHHEEWDEQVLDPETGEPTGEVEHREHNWDTWEKKVWPTAADYYAMGYVDVIDKAPAEAAPQGFHWERRGWEEVENAVKRAYVQVQDPPAPLKTYVTADLVEALMEEEVWEQARAWISEKGLLDLVLATKEFSEDNENFIAGRTALQEALGWSDEQVEELLARCVKAGY